MMEPEKLNPPPATKLEHGTRIWLGTYFYTCTSVKWTDRDWGMYLTKFTTKFKNQLGMLGQLRGSFQIIVREDAAAEHLVACDTEGVARYVFSTKPKKGEVLLAVKALGFDPEMLDLQKQMMEEVGD